MSSRSPAAQSRLEIGAGTRSRILSHAVDLASVEGLDGLSIGRLAADLEMSKSGLFSHFGSKEELQLATIEEARLRFIAEVFEPARGAAKGLSRLQALCEAWLSYAEREVFRGGCFFLAASAEFDGRQGPVRERIAAIMAEWLAALERAVTEAEAAGHLQSPVDSQLVAFELNAFMMAANFAFQLFGQRDAMATAERAMRGRIDALKVFSSST